MPRKPKAVRETRQPVSLSEDEREKVEDIKNWTDASSLAAAMRLAVDKYWHFLAWRRSRKEREGS